jgi:hypothetical protein
MKTMAGGSMLGHGFDITPKTLSDEDIPNVPELSGITLEELHQYVYSLPVSVLCSGCDTIERLEHNVGVLEGLKQLSDGEMQRIVDMAKPFAGFNVENYKRILS